MDIQKHVANATKIISWLSIRKVLLLALFCFVALVGFTAYEERTKLARVIMRGDAPIVMKRFPISDDVATQIRLLTGSPLISMIIVYAADLQLNERVIIYRYSDNQFLTELWDKHLSEYGTSHPVFTRDDVSNAHMVSIVNGEFSCRKYSTTINKFLVPKAPVPLVCFVSLPPFYGAFAGYLEISLTRIPTEIERQSIEIEMKRLSNDIFFKNVIPSRT